MFKLCVGVVLPIFITVVSCQVDSKVHIGIYYESLCRDSYKFITKQLGAVYDFVEDYVDILYVPFGKATSTNGGEPFTCQHEQLECEGNKIQSCALYLLTADQHKQTQFVVCQMHANSNKTIKLCSELVGLDYDKVLECSNSTLATKLQLEAEKLTNSISKPLSFVPTIVYNSEFNQDRQDRTIKDFLTVLCEQIKLRNRIAPTECTDMY